MVGRVGDDEPGGQLLEAVRWASAAGASAAMRSGAQASLPTTDDVTDLLN